MFDIATYSPGQGYDVNPDRGENAGGEQPPAEAPAPAAAPTADEARHEWMRKQGEARRAAAAPAPAATKEEEPRPAAEEQPAAEEKPPEGEPVGPYALQVPEFVLTKEVTEERQGYLLEFQELAPEVGINAATAQALLDVVVDSAVALDYVANPEATAEDARAEMTRLFGEKTAAGLIANAQKFTHARGEAFEKYLDTTGLGNDPAVLVALAFANSEYFSKTPAEAQKRIEELMKTPEFAKGDRLTQVKLHALSRIAHRDESENERLATTAKAVAPTASPTSDVGVRAEIAKLLDPKGPLLRGGPEQAAAKARYFELLKQLP